MCFVSVVAWTWGAFESARLAERFLFVPHSKIVRIVCGPADAFDCYLGSFRGTIRFVGSCPVNLMSFRRLVLFCFDSFASELSEHGSMVALGRVALSLSLPDFLRAASCLCCFEQNFDKAR